LTTDTCYNVGIKNITQQENHLMIYPNPCSTGNIYIETNNIDLPFEVAIYNTYGSVIKKFRIQQNHTYLSLNGFNKGIYLVIVHSKSDLLNAKFVINYLSVLRSKGLRVIRYSDIYYMQPETRNPQPATRNPQLS